MLFFKELYKHRLIRFFLVSGINTAFGYGLFALIIYLNVHYTIASIFSTLAGILFNFKTTGLIVFESKDNKLIFRFFSVYVIIYFVGIMSLAIFKLININEYIGGAIMLIPSGLLGYYLNKTFVFKNNKNDDIRSSQIS